MKQTIRIILIFAVFALFQKQAHAQFSQELTVQADAGYHYNMFRTPLKIISDNGTLLEKDSLVSKGFFQKTELRFTPSYKKGKHKFIFDNKFSYKLFPGLREANELFFRSKLEHNTKFNKNFAWNNELAWSRFRRDGLDNFTQDISLAINTYRQILFNTDFKVDLWKFNVTHFYFRYRNRQYEDTKELELGYPEYKIGLDGLQFITIKKKEKKKKTRHLLRYEASFTDRTYTRLKNRFEIDSITSEEFLDTTTISDRKWQYLRAGVSYKIPIHENFQIRPLLNFEKRMDRTDRRYSHNQISPGIKLHTKHKGLSGTASIIYDIRNYTTLSAKQSDGTTPLLKYRYLRLSGGFGYELKKNWKLHLNYTYIHRSSNTTDFTRGAFREFNDIVASVGISKKFKE